MQEDSQVVVHIEKTKDITIVEKVTRLTTDEDGREAQVNVTEKITTVTKSSAEIPNDPKSSQSFVETKDQVKASSEIWELVDLWDSPDEDMLQTLYNELLWPNYKDELAPLDFWRTALSSECRDNPFIGDLHVLIALKSKEHTNKKAIEGGVMFIYYPEINAGIFMYLVIHKYRRSSKKGLDALLLKNALTILDKNAVAAGNLAGCNAIFLETDPQDSLSPLLATVRGEQGSFALGASPSAMGPKAGSSAQALDLLDPRHQHAILHSLGFRLVDIEYVSQHQGTAKPRLLTVYLTSNIPTNPFEEGLKHYIPSKLLYGFVEHHWWSIFEINLVKCQASGGAIVDSLPQSPKRLNSGPSQPLKKHSRVNSASSLSGASGLSPGAAERASVAETEGDDTSEERREAQFFLDTMLQQIVIRDKVPLLDLPWGSGRLYTLVDLWEDYDEDLLVQFYDKLMTKQFSEWEIEPVANFIKAMSTEGREDEKYPDLHVLLALSWLPLDKSGEQDEVLVPQINGGLVFEYHPTQNCGLITYFLVEPSGALNTRLNQSLRWGRTPLTSASWHDFDSAYLNKSTSSFNFGDSAFPLPGSSFPFPAVGPNDTGNHFATMPPAIPVFQAPFLPSCTRQNGAQVPASGSPYTTAPNSPLIPGFSSSVPRNPTTQSLEHLPNILISEALAVLDYNAKSRGNLAGCNMILLEAYMPERIEKKQLLLSRKPSVSNFSPSLTSSSEYALPSLSGGFGILPPSQIPTIPEGVVLNATFGSSHSNSAQAPLRLDTEKESTADADGAVIDITQDHELLFALGFRLLNFHYVMPPYSSGQDNSNRFILTAYLPPLLAAGIPTRGSKYYLPSKALKAFVQNQWNLAFKQGHLSLDPRLDVDYLRMTKQLSLRQLVELLELPWANGVYTFVDLWDDYDQTLLQKFYDELLKPAYKEHLEELEPLRNLEKGFELQTKGATHVLDLHVLLAIKWVAPAPAKPSVSTEDDTSETQIYSGGKSVSRSKSKRGASEAVIVAGCVFEYYPEINCGLMSYLVTLPGLKDHESLLSMVVEQVIDTLNENAKSQGHVSGCNCVFWEADFQSGSSEMDASASSSASSLHVQKQKQAESQSSLLTKSNSSKSSEDLTQMPKRDDKASKSRVGLKPLASHEFAHRMGFRQLDLTYVVPPVSPEYKSKLKNYILTVLLTPNISRMNFEEGYQYGLPSAVISKFVKANWKSAFATGRIEQAPECDKDYTRSIEQIALREYVPLLDLPWAVKSWTFVDLWQDFDAELLSEFYQYLLVPNFPIKDELEPFEHYQRVLDPVFREECEQTMDVNELALPETHVIVALRYEEDQLFLGGAIVAEYYNRTNCGILTYLVVHKRSRGQGLAGKLVSRAVDILDKNAKKRGKLAGCNAVFLETNSAEKITPEQDVMDPRMRHVIYHKMGFRLIDYTYIMPPLAPGQSNVDFLLLTVFLTSSIPRDPYHNSKYYLPTQLLKNFVKGQWEGARAKGNLLNLPEGDSDYVRSIQLLDMREKMPLLDLPWTSNKPFTYIDMWEDFDEDLLYYFYKNLIVPRFSENGLEPLENWLSELSPNDHTRHSERSSGAELSESAKTGPSDAAVTRELHVLLGFDLHKYEESFSALHTRGNSTAAIGFNSLIGGLVFEYYPETNCVLITYIVSQGKDELKAHLAKFLIQMALNICDNDAKRHGHLAGCNAVFLETDLVSVAKTKGSQDVAESVIVPSLASSTVMVPAGYKFRDPLDHGFLREQGFRVLDFTYYQPPFDRAAPRARSVCLTILLTPRIPAFTAEDQVSESLIGQRYVPVSLMRSFLSVLWCNECTLIGYTAYEHDVSFVEMMNHLDFIENLKGSVLALDTVRAPEKVNLEPEDGFHQHTRSSSASSSSSISFKGHRRDRRGHTRSYSSSIVSTKSSSSFVGKKSGHSRSSSKS